MTKEQLIHAAISGASIRDAQRELIRACDNGRDVVESGSGRRVVDLFERDDNDVHVYGFYADSPNQRYYQETRWRVDDLEVRDEDEAPPFRKADAGKSIVGAVPPRALLAVGRVLAHGASKYGRDNWRNVDDVRRYHDAALRHVMQYLSGERTDAESGESHLAHAVCSLLFVLDIDERGGK